MNSTADLQELYQQVILDHNKKPRNFKPMENFTHHAEGFNPLCGDRLQVYVNLDEHDTIQNITFQGSGCAISKASASMMTVFLKGKTKQEAQEHFNEFHKLLIGKLNPTQETNTLGKLTVFSGIWQYPARVKCASLSWHTTNNALQEIKETAITE